MGKVKIIKIAIKVAVKVLPTIIKWTKKVFFDKKSTYQHNSQQTNTLPSVKAKDKNKSAGKSNKKTSKK